MHMMQYAFTLPADYDMSIIRDRVATRGARTDHFEDLGLKAYLIQERGKGGGLNNVYAPFYVWGGTNGIGRFLWGNGGFAGVVESFGRPLVHHWIGVGLSRGPSYRVPPRAAILHTRCIGPREDLIKASTAARAELAHRATLQGVYVSAVAIDPASWTLMEFTLSEAADIEVPGERYEVLHLSRPQLDELAMDR